MQVNSQKQGQALIDSLLIQLNKTKTDTTKVNLLNAISESYSDFNPDEGIRIGIKALKLAERIKWKRGIANAFMEIGINYGFGKADYHKALVYYYKALKIYKESGDLKSVAVILSNVGVAYIGQSNYPRAMAYLLKALKTNEAIGNKKNISDNLANIGLIYLYLSEYSKALEYNNKALKLYDKFGNKQGKNIVLINNGIIYYNQKDYSKALENYLKALDISEELGNINNKALLLNNIGGVYVEKKDLYKALYYYQSALELNRKLNANLGIALTLGNIGGVYYRLTNDGNGQALDKVTAGNKTIALDKAKIYTDSSIVVFKQIGDLSNLIYFYRQLSDIQTAMADYSGALQSYKSYSTLKDSVFNLEKDKKLTQSAMQYEFNKKVALAKAEQEKKDIRQRNIRNIIAGGLTGSLIFLTIVYRQRNKVKRERNRSDNLLLNILPLEVAEELKHTGEAQAKQFNNVTVLFTDFVNFTGISEQMSPTELVGEIHKNFKAFDEIVERHGLEKIKTIGDAYMAVCGLPNERADHAQQVIKAAIEIRNYIEENNGIFQIRIGVNSGSVVAGIVGIKKYAYDIWGDTVNTANRIESNGKPGKINISGNTYELVKDYFKCEYRGKITVKGKGKIDMYFVLNSN